MRTLKEIRAHYNKLYAKAEPLTTERICYGNIYRELRMHTTKKEAEKVIRHMRDHAPEESTPYYQEALDLLTNKERKRTNDL